VNGYIYMFKQRRYRCLRFVPKAIRQSLDLGLRADLWPPTSTRGQLGLLNNMWKITGQAQDRRRAAASATSSPRGPAPSRAATGVLTSAISIPSATPPTRLPASSGAGSYNSQRNHQQRQAFQQLVGQQQFDNHHLRQVRIQCDGSIGINNSSKIINPQRLVADAVLQTAALTSTAPPLCNSDSGDPTRFQIIVDRHQARRCNSTTPRSHSAPRCLIPGGELQQWSTSQFYGTYQGGTIQIGDSAQFRHMGAYAVIGKRARARRSIPWRWADQP